MATKKFSWRPDLISIAAVVLVVIIAIGLNGLAPKPTTAGIMDVVSRLKNTLLQDEVYSQTYAQLPTTVRADLNNQGFYGNDVKAILQIKASLMTRAASVVLGLANWVSTLSDVAIGKTVGPAQFKEAAEMTIAKAGISSTNTAVGELTLKVVNLADGAEIAYNVYQVASKVKDVSPPVVAAKAVAYALSAEMDAINQRVSKAYQDIGKLNPLTPGKTTLYFVWVQGGKQGNMLDKRGMLCYYLEASSRQYERYYSNLAGVTVTVKKK